MLYGVWFVFCFFVYVNVLGRYSGAKKYLVSYWLCKFPYLE